MRRQKDRRKGSQPLSQPVADLLDDLHRPRLPSFAEVITTWAVTWEALRTVCFFASRRMLGVAIRASAQP